MFQFLQVVYVGFVVIVVVEVYVVDIGFWGDIEKQVGYIWIVLYQLFGSGVFQWQIDDYFVNMLGVQFVQLGLQCDKIGLCWYCYCYFQLMQVGMVFYCGGDL